jgi:hypothetical protein
MTDAITKEFQVLLDMFSELDKKIENNFVEVQGHRIMIGDIEKRFQDLERKYCIRT